MIDPVKPKKSLGQNFLSDPNTARKIVGALNAPVDAHVVEIGPGMGALTRELLAVYPRFTAIEVDQRAVDYLAHEFPSLDVRHADVLDVDWACLAAENGRRLHVIGNLPYNLTSQILFSLLEFRESIEQAVVMMQLEVAERLVAPPRTKAYGILSVFTQLYAEPTLLFRVSRNVFFPKPEVTSAVVKLVFPERISWERDTDPAILRKVVRSAFNQRRKTLRNSLGYWTRDRRIPLPSTLENLRAEDLTPTAFVELARYLAAKI